MYRFNFSDQSKPVKILFVCLGNICRSPAAEEVMATIVRDKGREADFERMRAHAIRRGYKLTHRSRKVRPADFYDFDIIVAMDDANFDNLRQMAPTLVEEAKVIKMASFLRLHNYADCIPDPYYDGAEGFENVLDLLEDACLGLYNAIKISNS